MVGSADLFMLFVKAIIVGMVVTGVLGFVLIKYLSKTTEGAVTRLNRETEEVRKKQTELNVKIKEASEELNRRRAEADALVARMQDEANQKAKEEREKILAKARQEGEDIIAKAQKTKDEMRKAIEKEMEMKAIDFVSQILSETLSQRSLTALNEGLITEFLDNLEKVDMEMITEDIHTADVVTAFELAEQWKARLVGILQKKLNRTFTINPTVDKTILNGIVVRFGNLMLNGSLKHLIVEKAEEIKGKIEKGLT